MSSDTPAGVRIPMPSPDRVFFLLSDIMHDILARSRVVWTPHTRLADIDGWNSNKTVAAMLALERRLDRPLPTDALDRVVTVDDLVSLAARPHDATVAQRLSPSVPFARFESLGDSCEFGVVQQEYGIMQPHLLRFSSFLGDPAERLGRLIAALRDDFARVAEPELLDLRVPDQEWDGGEKEYRFVNTYYGWQIHTGLMVAAHSIKSAKSRLKDFPESLAFLREKQLRELRLGRKAWIWKSAAPSPQADVEALLGVLQKHGRNTLLWVLRADAAHPPGTIIRLRDNFFQAYIWKSDEKWSGDWSDSDSWRVVIDAAAQILPEPEPPPPPSSALAPSNSLQAALATLTDIVAAQIEDPTLVLTPDTTPSDIFGWDSLKHINIIMDVERRMGRTFDPSELDAMRTVADFLCVMLR